MSDTRHKNSKWQIHNNDDGTVRPMDAHLAVLMDIRDELQALNRILGCFRVRRMSDDINRLERRMAKKYPLGGRKRP